MPSDGCIVDGTPSSSEVLPQALLEELVREVPEGIVIQDENRKVLFANDEFGRMFGYTPDEVAGHRLDQLIASDGPLQESLQATEGVTGQISTEAVRRRKDGSLIEVSILGKPLSSAAEKAGYLIYRNITGQKQAEQELRESLARVRGMADVAPAGIYLHTSDRFLFVNQACETITGYTRDELLAMHPFDLVHPDHRALQLERWTRAIDGEQIPARHEYKILTRSGGERWLDFSGMIVEIKGEKAALAIVFDVTERKRAEQLQAALYQIAQQANKTRDMQALYTSVHSIVAGLLCCENFGVTLRDEESGVLDSPYFVDEKQSRAESNSLTDYILRTGESLLASREMLRELAANRETVPAVWLGVPLKNGESTFGVLSVQSYQDGREFDQHDQEMLMFVGQHVASAIRHKHDEESLRVSELRYLSLFKRAVYGIFRSSTDGRLLDANPALAAILGYQSPSDLIGRNLETDVYADPSERQRIIAEFGTGRRSSYQARWKRKDGSIVTVRLSAAVARHNNAGDQCYEVIAEDITEQRDLEEQLRHAQKMEAVGRLAGGLAHDFNNLLTVIKGYSELLADRFPTGDRGRVQLEEVRKAADRAAVLTGHLLALSRRQVLSPRVININQVIVTLEKMLRRVLGEDIELSTVLDPHLGNIKADPSQLEQVLMNLVVNARDAMPRGGQLILDTGNVTVGESEHAVLAPGRYVMLAVTDNGIGMDVETRSHVFEPFFTTKEHGTGLGLSTVYGIAKQSGGHTAILSEPGRGTTVKVYLPRVEESLDVRPTLVHDAPELQGTETILLVEDDDSVRPLVKEMLCCRGYAVIETAGAEEARAASLGHSRPIHLLLTDVVLQKGNGWDLSAQLLAQRPEMRVLFMSGYSEDTVQSRGVRGAGVPLLRKPFTARAIAEKVRSVLDNDSLGSE